MSAYDMTISDAIYGAADRYFTRQRLHSMLEHEYTLLEERLKDKRGANTRFFVFADTVKARGYKHQTDESNGWLGVRFQTEPLGPPSDVIIHVRMLDKENVPQQEALGVMGVNIIYAALYLHQDPRTFIHSLMDNLTSERVEVDMIKFSGLLFQRSTIVSWPRTGPARPGQSAMFTADGEVVDAAEVLYKRTILWSAAAFVP